jgi:Smg protein
MKETVLDVLMYLFDNFIEEDKCRGFLLYLEHAGVLNLHERELVIDRVMALETEEINIQQLKWVVLMVLFNQPDKEAAITWMEDIVMVDTNTNLH